MKPSSHTLSILGGLACLAVVASAQSQPETVSQPKPPPSVTNKADERPAPDEARFKSLDTDADGRISRSEFSLSPAPIPTDGEMATVPKEKKHWWNRSPEIRPSRTGDLFDQLDADSDGYLSRAEIAGQTKENGKAKK